MLFDFERRTTKWVPRTKNSTIYHIYLETPNQGNQHYLNGCRIEKGHENYRDNEEADRLARKDYMKHLLETEHMVDNIDN